MSFLKRVKNFRNRILSPVVYQLNDAEERLRSVEVRLEAMQEALGRIEDRQVRDIEGAALADYGYRVFSQWDEDGIIQFLIRHLEIPNQVFVEFGVQEYAEANTRFLLVNNNWTGLVIDSSSQNIDRIRRSKIAWGYGLKAVTEFVTRDNINHILTTNAISGDIGLLSIDIDGNDYWIWEAISVITPVIVVIEYNHRFGSEAAVTIPYDETFERGKTQPLIYFGASLAALCRLADRKGYAFVGCSRSGVNAFFVRRDRLPNQINEMSPHDGYVAGKFNEVMDEEGRFLPSSAEQDRQLLMTLPLVTVDDSCGRI